jgi:hypothetical protein
MDRRRPDFQRGAQAFSRCSSVVCGGDSGIQAWVLQHPKWNVIAKSACGENHSPAGSDILLFFKAQVLVIISGFDSNATYFAAVISQQIRQKALCPDFHTHLFQTRRLCFDYIFAGMTAGCQTTGY